MLKVDKFYDGAVGVDDDAVGFVALIVPRFGVGLVLGVTVRVAVGAVVGSYDLFVGDGAARVGDEFVGTKRHPEVIGENRIDDQGRCSRSPCSGVSVVDDSGQFRVSVSSVESGSLPEGFDLGSPTINVGGHSFPTTPGSSKTPAEIFVMDETLEQKDFAACPICLSEEDLTGEHLPPASVGGRVLTRTCRPCNNGFGSIEEALTLRRTGRLKHAAFTGDGVLGRRRVREVRVVDTEDGSFVIYLIGPNIPQEIQEIVKHDEFGVIMSAASPIAYKIASLKQLYLAACIESGQILTSDWGHHVREELMAALDAQGKPELGPLAQEVEICPGVGAIEPGLGIRPARWQRPDDKNLDGFAFGSFAFIGSRRSGYTSTHW